jgi:hypothetical protein
MAIARRALLSGLSGLAMGALSPPARGAEPDDLEVRDLEVEGDRALGRRFTLCVPRHLAPGDRAPLLVLLHGLGETYDARAGAWAWLERYGLASSYARLRRPPIARTSKRPDLGDARRAELDAALAARPFGGLVLACPYTPAVGKLPSPQAALEGYARWIVEVVVPRARAEAPVLPRARHVGLDGCSLGGFVGLEVFLRRTAAFGAWGGVQSAFGEHRAPGYAEQLERALAAAGPRPLHIETSTGDPFHEANVRLAAELARRGVARELRVSPGPHDQPWLREVGTLEMLLWHDRALRLP